MEATSTDTAKQRDRRKSKDELLAEVAELRAMVEKLTKSAADDAPSAGGKADGREPAASSLSSAVDAEAVPNLQLPQQPYQATFDQAPVGILHLRRDGTAIRANAAACQLLKSAPRILHENPLVNWILPADQEMFRAALEEVWSEELTDCAINSRLPNEKGDYIWGHVTFSLAKASQSGPRFMLVMISEITKQKQAESELRKSREQLRAVVSNAPIVLWALDRDGRLTLAEGAGMQALKLDPAQLVGQNVFELFADNLSIVAAAHKALKGTPGVSLTEFRDYVFESKYSPIHDERGEFVGVIGVATDVTQRVRAEAALQQAHSKLEDRVIERTTELSQANRELKREIAERKRAVEAVLQQTRILQSVLDSVGDGIAVCGTDGRLLLFNPAAEAILGIGLTDAEQAEWSVRYGLFLPDQKTPYPVDRLPLSQAMAGRNVNGAEIWVQHEELSEGIWINVNSRPLIDEHGNSCGGVAAFRDVTAEKKSRDKLRAEQRLLENSLAVHERDRQLMAYELHDGLVQDVTGALMHLEALRGKLGSTDADTDAKCDLVAKLLRQTITEARQVISGLRPPILDELGVVAAIAHLVDEQTCGDGPEIMFIHDVESERLAPLLEGTLFRIVQEALANVKHHAQAQKARVELTQQGDRIRLTVADNGVGFDPQTVPDRRFGLQGMRRRAELLRGQAEIRSMPGEGTRVVVTLPVAVADC